MHGNPFESAAPHYTAPHEGTLSATPGDEESDARGNAGKTGPSRTLYDLVTGDVACITRIRGGGPRSIRQRLLDMGVTRGTTVEVRRHAPLGDPVEVVIKGYYLALRMQEAREIEVEEVR